MKYIYCTCERSALAPDMLQLFFMFLLNEIYIYKIHVFQITNNIGKLKYKNITKVSKIALILFHGNADLKQGISSSNRLLT